MSKRKALLTGAAAILSGKAKAAAKLSKHQLHRVLPTGSWQILNIGGGGDVVALDIDAASGIMTQCGDVFSGWKTNVSNAGGNGNWQQLFLDSSVPSGQQSKSFWGGVYGPIKISKHNTNTMVALCAGSCAANGPGVLVTTNGGTTWQNVAITIPSAAWSGGIGGVGATVAFNPANDSEFIVGLPDSLGVWHCTSYGLISGNCTKLNPGSVASCVEYWGLDWIGNTVIISDHVGGGAYVSTTGPTGTYTAVRSGPSFIRQGKFASNGTYFCLDNAGLPSTANVWRLPSPYTTWTQIYTVGNAACAMALDPNNDNRLFVSLSNGGNFDGTMDFTTSALTASSVSGWNGANQNKQFPNGDCPWISTIYGGGSTTTVGIDLSSLAIDGNGALWMSDGVGVQFCSSPPTGTTNPYVWTPMNKGSEGLPSNWLIWLLDGRIGVISWDRPIFMVSDTTVCQTTYGPQPSSSTFYSESASFAQDGSGHLVMNVDGTIYHSSTGIPNWTAAANSPGSLARNGDVIAFSATSWCVVNGTSGAIQFTTNAGASAWSTATGSGDFNTDTFTYPANHNHHPICYDGTTAGVGYLVSQQGTVYKTANSGATWTQVSSSAALPGTSDNMRLKSPLSAAGGSAGQLFYSQGNGGHTTPTFTGLYFSNDGGATWTQVTNATYAVSETWDFGFTPAAPGHSYPSIGIYGFLNANSVGNLIDFWRCDNFNPATPNAVGMTWTRLPWPWVGVVDSVAGNPSTYNQWATAVQVGGDAQGAQIFK